MNKITKGVISVGIVLSLMVPALTQAASLTTAQVSAVVALLESFGVDAQTVTSVKNVLNGTASSTTQGVPPGQLGKKVCVSLMRDLGIGAKGEDVRSLQEMLAEDSDAKFEVAPTGYYGPVTAEAVRRFQAKNKVASATGTIGPVTRGFLERRCGRGLGGAVDPRRDGGPNRDRQASTTSPRSEHATSTPGTDDNDDETDD